jgi:hypothetical protein
LNVKLKICNQVKNEQTSIVFNERQIKTQNFLTNKGKSKLSTVIFIQFNHLQLVLFSAVTIVGGKLINDFFHRFAFVLSHLEASFGFLNLDVLNSTVKQRIKTFSKHANRFFKF